MQSTTGQLVSLSAILLASLGGELARGEQELKVVRSRQTGHATFLTTSEGGPIRVPNHAAAAAAPLDLLDQYGHLFGIQDVASQLRLSGSQRDLLGHTHTEFRQVHQGVRVFGGFLRTHQNERSDFYAVNGAFHSIPDKLSVAATLAPAGAQRIAAKASNFERPDAGKAELLIVDPGWYGDRPQGARLAYRVRVQDGIGRAEGFFIEAHSGAVLDRWNLIAEARDRRIHDGNGSSALPGLLVRTEGQGPAGDFEVNRAYDYAGDTYDFYSRGFGRDSYSNSGQSMIVTVNSTAPSSCPNAFWNSTQTVFCAGLARDDVVGHEFTHGVVEYTANLIYQNQSGQLNESYADIFGELIDLFNGDVSLPGPPAGPAWPVHPTGPGPDLPNDAREGCIGGVYVEILNPKDLAGRYLAGRAQFGAPLDLTGITGEVAQADPFQACEPIDGNVAGKIALIGRGTCAFDDKALAAQVAGAIGVIIVNNVQGGPPPLGGDDPVVVIPVVSMTLIDGQAIETALAEGPVTATLAANPSVGTRWLLAEDDPEDAFRDMWMPSCKGHPDSGNHPFQTCNPADNGGVHSGSGVPNHAFALATDGGEFRGFIVEGIGPIKTGAAWYRALTAYLGETSDFEDAYAAIQQAALDLVGTFPLDPRTGFPSGSLFTAEDVQQIDLAMQAVEMNSPGRCGAITPVLDPTPPQICVAPNSIYTEDFDQGTNDWSVSNTSPPTPYDWVQRGGLPYGMQGAGWFVDDPSIGNCQTIDESGAHYLTSPLVFVYDQAQEVFLSFTHHVATEPAYDGGNVKLSINDGPFELIPAKAFLHNSYNTVLEKSNNPLAGEPAFSGRGGEWGVSLINLTGIVHPGDLVQFRFDFGKDGCAGVDGWYLGDFSLFYCIPTGDGDFDGDFKVTLADFGRFANCYSRSVRDGNPCVHGDLDGNGVVNYADVPLLLQLLGNP